MELIASNDDKLLVEHLRQYFSKSFLKFPRLKNQSNHSNGIQISSHYLAQFTNIMIVPTKNYFIHKCNLLTDLGSIWLNQYIQKIMSKNLKFLPTNGYPFTGHLKLKYTNQWQQQVQSVEEFYLQFQLNCPICSGPIQKFDPNCNIISLLASHKCNNESLAQLQHHCPCGEKFPDHMSFLRHILPVSVNQFDGLILAPCPMATFYWLFIAISSAKLSDNIINSFGCTNCSQSPLVERDTFVNLDFFSWMYHSVYECQSFSQRSIIKTDGDMCFFCPLPSSTSEKIVTNSEQYNSNIANCLNTDFNLSLFKQENFFDFSLDFNLSQKMRPSDFLSQESFSFSKEELNKLDLLFLSLPYSCSKCLIRFKDISLKYNHSCYIPRGDKSCNATHVCRCGNLTENHVSFWYHVFEECFILTYLYLILFCLLKKIDVLKCFCDKFSTTSNSLQKFIEHWKNCHCAFQEFSKHCRHCHGTRNAFRDSTPDKMPLGFIEDCTNTKINPVENNKLTISCHVPSLTYPSMSLVANRCQIFSSNIENNSRLKEVTNNFKFGTLETTQMHEQGVLIQPTFHLLQNISMKMQEKPKPVTVVLGCASIQPKAAVVKIKRFLKQDNFGETENNLKTLLNQIKQMSPGCVSTTMDYINSYSTPMNIEIKFNKSIFVQSNCFGKLQSFLNDFLSKWIGSRYSNNPKPIVVEYLEEPPTKPTNKPTPFIHFFKKIMNSKKQKDRIKFQSSISMLPLFRKLALPKYQNSEEILSTKTLRVQYLEPSFYLLSDNKDSKSVSEINSDGCEGVIIDDVSDCSTSKIYKYYRDFDNREKSFASA